MRLSVSFMKHLQLIHDWCSFGVIEAIIAETINDAKMMNLEARLTL